MLKLSSKRTYDSLEQHSSSTTPLSCSPHRIQFLESPMKRVRTRLSPPSSPLQRAESLFPQLPSADVSTLMQDTKRVKRTPQLAIVPQTEAEPLFTESQVRVIVEKAIAEREVTLRGEYDRILQEQLQEQYRNFAKFHEDYISRQLRESDFSYMS